MNMYMGNGILYSNSEMLNETFYIYKAENDSSIQCGNIDSYNGKKTGVLKNDQRMVAVCNLEDIIKKQILSSGIRRRKHLQTLYLLKIKNPATLKRG
ncbi:hypothetical protein [Blautia sp.]|uniref:hypothetical protein n=1 Tax=Blautia sp. TaxID=1955243 RepID=UPI003AB3736B